MTAALDKLAATLERLRLEHALAADEARRTQSPEAQTEARSLGRAVRRVEALMDRITGR